MNVTKIAGKGNDLVLHIKGLNFNQMNTLRRVCMNETPVMAIEDVEFKTNNSVLYDEMLGLRLGLLPLTTDLKGYNAPDKCTCKGAGCAKCQVELSLSAKGPGVVFASSLTSKDPKVKPVYPETPLVKLLEEQEVELVAKAQLGQGKQHAKWSACLAYYRQKPTLTIGKNADAKSILKNLKGVNLHAISEKSGKLVVDQQKLMLTENPDAYEDISKDITVSFSEDEFIFVIESWGQLSPKEIIDAGIERMLTTLKEFEKLTEVL